MKRERSFPPGIGWIPVLAAVALALLVALFQVSPQFATRVVGTAAALPGGAAAGVPGVSTSAAPGANQVGPNGQIGRSAPGGAGSAEKAPSGGGTAVACAAGKNGGATDKGVTANQIHVASTIVTTGIGSGFLGEAADGMRAAIDQVNQAGGICGRRITSIDGSHAIETINDGWDGPTGDRYIQSWCQGGSVFALVGEPDSQGLANAIENGDVDHCGIPVVGTDGMLSDQYYDPLVWPVAASTVTNMHIIAKYAVEQLHAKSFGIVYDTYYRFGAEGANAFDQEVRRLTGHGITGDDQKNSCAGSTAFCGINAQAGVTSSEVTALNLGCGPCDVVVLLLEPKPAEDWMSAESGNSGWYNHLLGGEPLFDDQVGENCPGCGDAKLQVWTGYHAASQPFDSEKAVYTYCQALKAVNPSDDCHNEFTEGAYLGAMMFIKAAQTVGAEGLPLTRSNLKDVLDSQTFDLGLSQPLHYGSGLPHLANTSMAAFSENYSGTFNGWNYDATGFVADPAPGSDLH